MQPEVSPKNAGTFRSSRPEVFVKKVFLKISQNLQENTCTRASFLIKLQACRPEACNFITKETLTQVFSSKFCEIFKNTFFIEQLRWLLLNFSQARTPKAHSRFILKFQ